MSEDGEDQSREGFWSRVFDALDVAELGCGILGCLGSATCLVVVVVPAVVMWN